MASSLGTLFRITSFGESHGGGVGVVVDGCPPRLPLDVAGIQADLDWRRPGQSAITALRRYNKHGQTRDATERMPEYEGLWA